MSDVEKEIDELQCKLTAKTREIEELVAGELNLGDINAMEGTAGHLPSYVHLDQRELLNITLVDLVEVRG